MEVGDGSLRVAARGGDIVANAAEEIDFPGGVETGAESVDGVAIVEEAGDLLLGVRIADICGNDGIALELALVVHGASFGEARLGNEDVVIGDESFFHEVIEYGIVELLPPFFVERRGGGELRVGGMKLRRGRLRSFVMRADGAAGDSECCEQRKMDTIAKAVGEHGLGLRRSCRG